jgi:hypothetical protein
LLETKNYIVDGTNFTWVPYEHAKALNKEIEKCIEFMKAGKLDSLDEIYSHYLPTATFQEHAIANKWHKEYEVLAVKFDRVYNNLSKGLRLKSVE